MLIVEDLAKQYGDFTAVDHVSLQAVAVFVTPNIVMLFVAAAVFGGLAVRRFRYEQSEADSIQILPL